MTEAQRHQILLDLLAQTGFVTVEQVISRLGISPATARRDINKLDESGKLKKVRNGAEAVSEQRPRWSPMTGCRWPAPLSPTCSPASWVPRSSRGTRCSSR